MEKTQRSEIHRIVAMICRLAGATFANELPVRVVTTDEQPPERPYAKIAVDFNGDGLPDVAIGGAKGPLVWCVYPAWKKGLVAEGGYETVEGEAADIDNDGRRSVFGKEQADTLWVVVRMGSSTAPRADTRRPNSCSANSARIPIL